MRKTPAQVQIEKIEARLGALRAAESILARMSGDQGFTANELYHSDRIGAIDQCLEIVREAKKGRL
ncbi:MAG: hypothetical protein IMZ50_10445 [Candidatus Atribacteria bacterium]|nr:hypothetical protein [Candidatus Atribacteria bacterium]